PRHLLTPCCPVSLLPTFLIHAPPPTQPYTLSLHDALPILPPPQTTSRPVTVTLERVTASSATPQPRIRSPPTVRLERVTSPVRIDRKSTRLNSSHVSISYAVFCLKKKKVN